MRNLTPGPAASCNGFAGLDKRNFRKRVLALRVLEELEEVQQGVAHRAARLYRFDERSYRRLEREGWEIAL